MKVVAIGGRNGVVTVLSGFKDHTPYLTAVVPMSDDIGSTGILREEFDMLPPGDVRHALLGLSSSRNKILLKLFDYRFEEGSGLKGHSLGNLIIAALQNITGSFEGAIQEVSKILSVKGSVLPTTLHKPRLFAEFENNKIVRGEGSILNYAASQVNSDKRARIKRVWLKPKAKINPKVQKALLEASVVVIGPDNFYTSIIPHFLVEGVPETLKKSKARKIYVGNLMTKVGKTDNFCVLDFVNEVEEYLGKNILDYVIVNTAKPSLARLKEYTKEGAFLVTLDKEIQKPIPITGDFLTSKGQIRHDPEKLVKVIVSLI